jgi:hypothetical protein
MVACEFEDISELFWKTIRIIPSQINVTHDINGGEQGDRPQTPQN